MKDPFNLAPEARAVIVDVLCGQALADHLGDVRDAERDLWRLLDVAEPDYDHDSAWRNTHDNLKRHSIPLPSYLGGYDDDEDE